MKTVEKSEKPFGECVCRAAGMRVSGGFPVENPVESCGDLSRPTRPDCGKPLRNAAPRPRFFRSVRAVENSSVENRPKSRGFPAFFALRSGSPHPGFPLFHRHGSLWKQRGSREGAEGLSNGFSTLFHSLFHTCGKPVENLRTHVFRSRSGHIRFLRRSAISAAKEGSVWTRLEIFWIEVSTVE